MAKSPNKNDRKPDETPVPGAKPARADLARAESARAEPDVEIWSGGLQWALQKGYQKTDTLDGVRQELGLWLENLNELIAAFGPKAPVGEVLAKAGDDEVWEPGQPRDAADDDED